jgi:FkbM family methyltransferase
MARVYALEPMERTYWRLSGNILVNRLFRRIEAHRVAASDEDGRAELNVYRGARVLGTGSSLVAKEDQTATRTQPVETVRLDTFVREQGIPGVDLVKLDVERYELQAIGGMAGLLEHKPAMLVEVFSSEALREIAGLLSPTVTASRCWTTSGKELTSKTSRWTSVETKTLRSSKTIQQPSPPQPHGESHWRIWT